MKKSTFLKAVLWGTAFAVCSCTGEKTQETDPELVEESQIQELAVSLPSAAAEPLGKTDSVSTIEVATPDGADSPIAPEAEDGIILIQGDDGSAVRVQLDSRGIIQGINGAFGETPVVPLTITSEDDGSISLGLKYSGDGCFRVRIIPNDKGATVERLYKASGAVETFNVCLGNGNTILYDECVSVRKTEGGCECVFDDHKKSPLPNLVYTGDSTYQSYGGMGGLSFKYVYTKEGNGISVVCSRIMPGELFEEFAGCHVTDIAADDRMVNLLNYIIINYFSDMQGAMLFPVLMGLPLDEVYLHDCIIRSDSYLTENDIGYAAKCLNETIPGRPWVEGEEGDGVGSLITISSQSSISVLVISNGFVSNNPRTYTNNNRVKDIKITDRNDEGKSFAVTLPDSPEPFEILLPFSSSEIQLEIQSVYKGEKYDDTCLNYIRCR